MIAVFRSRRANADIEDALEFYRAEAPDQGFELIDVLETAVARIAEHPGIGWPRYASLLDIPRLRHWAQQRFPYGLFYLEYQDRIEVIRFLHLKRDIAQSLANDE